MSSEAPPQTAEHATATVRLASLDMLFLGDAFSVAVDVFQGHHRRWQPGREAAVRRIEGPSGELDSFASDSALQDV